MEKNLQISVILPVFNEQDNIHPLVDKLKAVLGNYEYEIIFIDDGSLDKTMDRIKTCQQIDPRISYLSFSRNFGHQYALKAGLDHAQGKALIFMDADLQHPPALLNSMIDLWQKGAEIVYTVRRNNLKLPFWKRATAVLFYRVLKLISDFPLDPGRADFFLIDRKVAEVLKSYGEYPLFFRGILPWIGFNQKALSFEVDPRLHGTTKYSFKKMIELAIDGVTSSSIKPLRISSLLGILLSLGAFVYLMDIVYIKFFTHEAVSGWASILASVLLIGGVELIILGIIGEYLGKLYITSQRRPLYILRESSFKGDHA